MTLRKLEKKDLPELTELSRSTFIKTFSHLNNPDEFEAYVAEAFSEKQILSELNDSKSAFYFIKNEEIVLGYCKLNFQKSPADSDRPNLDESIFGAYRSEPMTELERIYLKSAYQGKGFAADIMKLIEAVTAASGSTCLWLGVWEMNPQAIRYYEKCGFVPIGAHVFQIGDDAQTDFLMLKKL